MTRKYILSRVGLCVGLFLLVALTAPTAPVAAQEILTGPSQTYDVNAGPYPLHIIIWGNPVRTQHNASVEIVPGGGVKRDDLKVQAVLMPAPGTAASIIPLPVRPSDSNTTSLIAQIAPQERGTFILRLNVSGPEGNGTGDVSFPVQGPPAIPAWLGWLIGLLPLAGLALFVAHEVKARTLSEPTGNTKEHLPGTPVMATATAPRQVEA